MHPDRLFARVPCPVRCASRIENNRARADGLRFVAERDLRCSVVDEEHFVDRMRVQRDAIPGAISSKTRW
jgi:hypothetical protein